MPQLIGRVVQMLRRTKRIKPCNINTKKTDRVHVYMWGTPVSGKSTLSTALKEEKPFINSYYGGLGEQEFTKTVSIENKPMQLIIHKLPGQDEYEYHILKLFQQAEINIGIFVFSVSSAELNCVMVRCKEISKARKLKHFHLILIGNKVDNQDRKIGYEEAKNFADTIDAIYFETSAHDYTGVQDLLNCMVSLVDVSGVSPPPRSIKSARFNCKEA